MSKRNQSSANQKAQAWLAPCDVIRVAERQPPLRKEVLALDSDEDANQMVTNLAHHFLADPLANLLVFVYQPRSAESLARQMLADLGDLAGSEGVDAYHARLTKNTRQQVRQSFVQGRRRCLISTTALGMGVNLPATHVIVRDTTFPVVGRLSITDLLQMMGRAGRGDQPGYALALVRANDDRVPDELAQALHRLPPRLARF